MLKNGKKGRNMISYNKLWETMNEKSISQYRLKQEGIDVHTIHDLKRNKNITMLTLEKICLILNCTPNDVVEFISESKKSD